MEENKFLTTNTEETQRLAEDFGKKLTPGDIVLLYGDLGSGKTTFVQGLAKGLGIKQRIISPTFIIIRSYEINPPSGGQNLKYFYHIDLYRMESEKDIESVGLNEILQNKDAIIAIEWAEKLGEYIPKNVSRVYFEHLGEEKRKITIKNG